MTGDKVYTGITSDSRTVKDGMIFAALQGTSANGVNYIPQALQAGATAILVDESADLSVFDIPECVRVMRSADARRDLALWAAQLYPGQPGCITAVTGTNGKTSVAWFVQYLFRQLGKRSASLGTLGVCGDIEIDGSMTTPDPVQLHQMLMHMHEKKVTHLCVEASSHGLDQRRLEGVSIKAAAFTNLTRDHLDYHGDVESYFLAKKRLFTELLSKESLCVVYQKGDYNQRVVEACKALQNPILTYGSCDSDLAVLAVENDAQSIHASVRLLGEEMTLDLPLLGAFQLDNVLAALGLVLSDTPQAQWHETIAQLVPHLADIEGVPGRMELISGHPQGAAVSVDYAHTPDALMTALQCARPHTSRRLICVFGCGGDRDKGKRPLMARAVADNADIAILTDDNPRSEDAADIRRDAKAGAPNAIEIAGREAAINHALSLAQAGDHVLIAGKGHEQGQMIQGVLHPFDDRDVAKAWIKDQA